MSKPSSRRGSIGDDKSTGSSGSVPSVARVSREQQLLARALSDLESSFERESHSARYTSHVLDINSQSNNNDDDISITSRNSSDTSQWFLSRDNDPTRQSKHDDNDDSSQSSGLTSLWQRQQNLMGVEGVDQSLNLMDHTNNKTYDEDPLRKAGLQSFGGPKKQQQSKKGDSFSFPFLPKRFGDLRQMESEIKRRMQDPQHQGKRNVGWKWIILVTFFFLFLSISVTVVVVINRHQHNASHRKPITEAQKNIQNHGSVVKSGSEKGHKKSIEKTNHQQSSSPGRIDPDPANLGRSWDDGGTTIAEDIQNNKDEASKVSHDYEVTTNPSDNIPVFHPTITLPAKTRSQALLAILLELQISQPDDILDKNKQSAAYRALKWIADDDPAKLPFPSFYYQSPHTAKLSRHDEEEEPVWRDDSFVIQQILQRYVLAVFFFSVGLPPESDEETPQDTVAMENNARLQKSWLSEDHVCHWQGVDCGIYDNTGRERAGVESVHMSSVVSVNLTRHQLAGTLPAEWLSTAALPDLASIDLSYNQLLGTLPNFTFLSKEDLNTDHVKITTSTAEYILRFPQATNNSLISSLLPTVDTPELLHVDLSFNQFTGNLPSWGQQLKHCLRLFLNHNRFAGPLDSLLGEGSSSGKGSKLEQIDIGNNLLTGTLSSKLASLSNLQLLSLESNFFSGSIPEMFDQLDQLVELHMNDNLLEGTLPPTMGRMTSIEKLHLEHNELKGSVPFTFDQMTTLRVLTLHHNAIEGSLPTFWGSRMTQLADLWIHNNHFRGSIPSELGSCSSLKRLYLNDNFFRESVPSWLGNLVQLETLRLFGNRLTGTMPTSVCNLLDRGQLDLLSADCTSGHIECGCCNGCF